MDASDDIRDSRELAEVVRRLVEHFHPDNIFLFGSHARGTQTRSSDWDILVIMPELSGPAYRYSQRAYELLSGISLPKDLLFISKEKFEFWRETVGTLAEAVAREGKELYAAAA